MADSGAALSGIEYLDMQAYVGITKHVGGIEATNELLACCHIADARQVLNVGCRVRAQGSDSLEALAYGVLTGRK
jgi:hypothetical protein